MRTLFLLFFIPTVILGQECESGWTYYKQYCYKHFQETIDRVRYTEAEHKCVAFGGHLAPMWDDDSLYFLGNLTKQNTNVCFRWIDEPLIGVTKDAASNWVYAYDSKTPPYRKYCPGFDGSYWYNRCSVLFVDNVIRGYNRPIAPCFAPTNCNNKFSRYICRTPLKRKHNPCKHAHSESRNGKCVCEKGYIDITETDVPERRKYKQGEKCISMDPCREAKDLTVNFIVDSSESIGSTNWKSLVEFLKSGANFLPSTTRVGFVKYSTNVTFAEFLAPGWSKKKFQNFVPSEYENGGTNTPEALDKARKMFKGDSNRNQVAVLITDGVPFVDGLDLKEAVAKSKTAAEKLRSNKINLIVLGYGDSLYKDGHKYIQEWLEDPEEDYFSYDKLACDFKELHMSILMRKVCRRYVKD